MSATGRGGQRHADDYYETPAWCVDRLLDAVPLPGGRWLEPSAGTGAIMRAVDARRDDVRWSAVELSPERARECGAEVADFLTADLVPTFDVVITNPPFCVWQQVVERALVLAPQVVMLLRIDVLGSAKRAPWWRAHPADVFVLPSRPSFTGNGATDANNYAWFRWLRGALPPASLRWLAVR